ncbi:MAG: CAP domain-containing protein [Bacteroidia bacterium]
MKKLVLIFTIIVAYTLIAFTPIKNAELNKEEAKKAFEYLNQFRANPKEYGDKLKLNLKKVDARPALVWNETLAKVAEERAMDMAENKYFSHINKKGQGVNILIHEAGYTLPKNWIKNKQDNFFESIQAGAKDGIDAINDLIIDKGTESHGHRKHLLGIDDDKAFNSKLKDIGIGFVSCKKGCQYISYTCVIIAMQEK